MIGKVLASAVANAAHNDQQNPEELYVSACYADEGTTLKRWRPRARGRATRIRKRTCHITIIVSRLPDDRLERRRARHGGRSAPTGPAGSTPRGAGPTCRGACRAGEPPTAAEAEQPAAEAEAEDAVEADDVVDRDAEAAAESRRRARPTTEDDDAEDDDRDDEVDGRGRRRDEDDDGETTTAAGEADSRREGQVDGPEGQPLRLPARHHHRLEVPLVRGAPLPRTSWSRTGRSATT